MAKPVFPGEHVVGNKIGLRSYVNPKIYEPTPPKPTPEFRVSPLIIKTAIAFGLIVIVVWVLFASPIFKIKHIQVKGQARPETLSAIKTLNGKNIFLIGSHKSEAAMIRLQPGIKNIKILRGLPDSLIIELVERDPALVWVTQSKSYLIDKDGYVFKESESNLPKIIDGKNLPVALGDRISSTSFITFIRRLYLDLPTYTSLEISDITVPETTFQIEANTKNNIKLKIDTSRNLNDQLADIKYIIDHNRDDVHNLIDVRLSGVAYIK